MKTLSPIPHSAFRAPRSIRPADWNYFIDICERFCAPMPTEEPFDWSIAHVVFDDSEVKGPFNPVGREYLREMINDANDPECREQTVCSAVGVGKTLRGICTVAWKIVHRPCRGLFIMPATKGEGGAETYVTSRLAPCLKSTKAVADLMPDIQERLFLNSKKIRINGSHFGFVGSNSTTQLGSNRCGHVEFDELDKMKGRLGHEAGAEALGKERVEGVLDYQIFRNSTPTIETGGIWRGLLKSDFRRRFLPCPHCNSESRNKNLLQNLSLSEANLKGWFALAWNEQYCVLPRKINLPATDLNSPSPGQERAGVRSISVEIPQAFIAWDKEAKRRDDTYDLDRVFRSTRLVCPHCQAHIRDESRVWMDKQGIWLPTQEGTPHHKGYHLSSLYAPPLWSNENSLLGGRALKFLNCFQDGEGMKGFINSSLAEVDVAQEHGSQTIEISGKPVSQPDWVALLTADFHKNAPYIWFVVRKWCAFKLLPPVNLADGIPQIEVNGTSYPLGEILEMPGNETALAKCLNLVGTSSTSSQTLPSQAFRTASPALTALTELYRFKSGDVGESPILDFLVAQKITGDKLVKLFRQDAAANTQTFRRLLLMLMWEHQHGKLSPQQRKDFHAPRGGDSELLAAGYLDTSGPRLWEDLRDIEKEFHVGAGLTPDKRCTAIDCGFQEKFDAEVLQQSYERADWFKWYLADSPKSAPLFHGGWAKGDNPSPRLQGRFSLPCAADGWLPLRGIPTIRPQGDGKITRDLSLRIADPYTGSAEAGTRVIEVLNVPSMLFWHRRQDLRQRKTKNTWTISPNVSWFPKHYQIDGNRTEQSTYRLDDYIKQSDGQYYDERTRKVEPKGGRGGSQSKKHPYHVDDCETYQVALATHHEFFESNDQKK